MDILEFKNYFCIKKRISIPELQKELPLSYSEIRSFIDQFLQLGLIRPADELYYELDEHRLDAPRAYVFLLYQCIKTGKNIFDLKIEEFHMPKEIIPKAYAWMLKHGYMRKKTRYELGTIDLKEFLIRFSEYLPFPYGQNVQMNPSKEKARSILWDYMEANPNGDYKDFRRYCLHKAIEFKKTDENLSSEFIIFIRDYGIHSEASFYICKKEGRQEGLL